MNATRQPNDAGGPYQLIDEFIVDVPLEDEVAPKSANPRSWTPSDGPRPEIECAYAAGKDILVGTSDGNLIHYTLDDGGRPHFARKRTVSPARKAIDDVLLLSSHGTVLVLTDATLFVLELSTLSIALNATANVFKGVSAVCVDSSASSSGKISFARRRSICNAEASTQGLIITKEINITLESVIMMMRRQGTSICFADAQGYKLLDTAELRLVPLFPHDRTYGSPLVESVDDDEFLVATGGEKHDGLGVYLSMTGDPASRGTLAFPSYPNSFVFQYPYAVSLLRRTTIQVNYVTDEQVAQSITLPREAKGLLPWFLAHDSEELGSSDILVPFSNGVSLLRKRPFREEVHRLVRSGQAAQAAALVENVVRRPHLDGDAAASALTSNYLDMALCMVSETMFDDALVMLKRVAVDPRSVLELLPEIMDLLRGMFSEQPNDVVAQHGSLEIMVLAYLSDNFPEADESFGREFLLAGKRMFAEYLFWYRSRPKVDTELVVICDTAIVALYLEIDPPSLYAFLAAHNECDIPVVTQLLRSKSKYYGLSLLYYGREMSDQAWQIWKDLLNGLLLDNDFPGPSAVGSFVEKVQDPVVFWDKAKIVFDNDPVAGLQILKAIPQHDPRMNGDKALDFLSPYGRQPSIAYLEWLINETNNADARHHTHLAVLYLDELLALAGGPQGIAALETSFKRLWPRPSFLLYLASLQHDPVAQARTKLLHFLQSSGHVRTASFLAKLATVGEMVAEKAVVLAKSGDYDRSLKLLVHDLCDYVGAEALCTALVRDSSSSRTANNPFTSLYHLYLDIPDDRYRTEQILRLLGNSRNTATVSDVIGSLPADWGLALAIPYLQRALRADEHAMRWGAIERQLSKVQNLRASSAQADAFRSIPPAVLRINQHCSVCEKSILQPVFVRRQDGVFHIHCANKC